MALGLVRFPQLEPRPAFPGEGGGVWVGQLGEKRGAQLPVSPGGSLPCSFLGGLQGDLLTSSSCFKGFSSLESAPAAKGCGYYISLRVKHVAPQGGNGLTARK